MKKIIGKMHPLMGEQPLPQPMSQYSFVCGNDRPQNKPSTQESPPYRQFVTTMLDAATNRLVQISSQPPPDYVAVKRRRNRTTVSCLSCKRRKVKCDRERPICGSCQRHGYTVCNYNTEENTQDSSPSPQSPQSLTSPPTPSSSPILEFNCLLKTLDKLKETHVQNDEIDQLREKIENLRFYLDDKTISNCKSLKGLNLVEKLILVPILKSNSTVSSLDSFNLQFGASSITSYVDIDHYMGTLYKKALPKIENDIKVWKSKFSVDIYRKALEMCIISENFNNINNNSSLDDVKRSKFRFICSLLQDYFINYQTFIKLLNNSTSIMISAVPVVPQILIDEFLKSHFHESPDGKLIIANIDSTDDFSEILLILAVLRFGLPKSENVISTPNEIDFTNLLQFENILTDNKTDLLNSFLKIILNETDLSQKYNIPMLGTLIILFMISYTHRFNFKSGNTGIGLNYGIIAIYMAVNLGIYSKTGISDKFQNITSNSQQRYMKFMKLEDYHNIWNLVMFIDTFSSFNSGIPQLISGNMENIYLTKFLDSNCASICNFYRKSFKLAISENLTNTNDVSIIQYERFVIEFETFIFEKITPTSICLEQNDLVGVATSIRSLNLLLFLYYNSYFSVMKTIENFKLTNNHSNNKNYSQYLIQFEELDKRLFERCIRLSIISLINLNNMLVSTFSEKDGSFYEKYSFDLIQIFTRIIYTLTSSICKMISLNKSKKNTNNTDGGIISDNIESFNYLFDISRKQSEELSRYFVALQSDNLNGTFAPDIINIFNKVIQLSHNPMAMIRLLIGFFFNTSQSLISQNFIYYALYKYFVMAVKEFQDMPGNLDDFNIDTFLSHYSHVDCTWFINK